MANKVNPQFYKSAYKNFELLCISLLVDAYKSAVKNNQYDCDWKENSFTNHLISFIHSNPTTTKNKLFVKPQVEPENDNLPVENTDDDPDKQPRIDIWYGNWSGKRNEFFIEAKNICDKDWVKNDGSKVSASQLKRRYITTGIENYITKKYPKGCLAGYVLNSNTIDCINGINKLLIKYGREKELLVNFKVLDNFSNTFLSKHNQEIKSIELKHVFLEF